MQALLARIAEHEDACGFAGVVLRNNGETMVLTTFNANRCEVAMAGAMLTANALEDSDDV